jgi:predicted dehydrogenase
MKHSHVKLSRRSFLRCASGLAASVSIVPGAVLGLNGAPSPNNKLNVACIGVGGRGAASVGGVGGENIVALCDVDRRRANDAKAKHPNAKFYQDFRRMFDEMEKQIDAVTVATPDHTHAVAAMAAIKRNKHVYSEKPLAHCLHETHALVTEARQRRIATQLGNQGHSSDSIRRFCEMIWSGAIGKVQEVHAFCGSQYSKVRELDSVRQPMQVPEGLDWDLWIGPAQFRPYHSAYHPGKWRGWLAFGTGVIGDWVCHVVDPVFWALDLGAPISIQAQVFDYDPKLHAETCPPGTIITYQFPPKGERPPVKLVWYDGTQRPPPPPELQGEKLPSIGAIVVGEQGKILYGSHGAGSCRLIPDEKMVKYRQTEKPPRIEKSPGHFQEWLRACKGGKPAGSNFDYGGPLTDIALLGIIAFRFPGQKLEWDGSNRQFTNFAEANKYIKTDYRKGWTL